ncbi:MAG: hypothetical protein PHQ81_11735 [Methanofollis sp.]|nr:hypothetical protein [Methanofollis sp.]
MCGVTDVGYQGVMTRPGGVHRAGLEGANCQHRDSLKRDSPIHIPLKTGCMQPWCPPAPDHAAAGTVVFRAM